LFAVKYTLTCCRLLLSTYICLDNTLTFAMLRNTELKGQLSLSSANMAVRNIFRVYITRMSVTQIT
jgi:hypothetical protein